MRGAARLKAKPVEWSELRLKHSDIGTTKLNKNFGDHDDGYEDKNDTISYWDSLGFLYD